MNETVSESSRACAGCRQTDARDVLLRFVADGDPPMLAPDIRRRAPGRGVSVHARFRCVEAAVRNGALRRGLGLPQHGARGKTGKSGKKDIVEADIPLSDVADAAGDMTGTAAADTRPLTQSARELSKVAAEQYLRRATSLLSAAKSARKLALGTEAVRQALAARSVQLLLVASDAEGDREELVAAAERLGRGCLVWKNREQLGQLFGRSLLSIVGVLDAGIATELRHVVRCATELEEGA